MDEFENDNSFETESEKNPQTGENIPSNPDGESFNENTPDGGEDIYSSTDYTSTHTENNYTNGFDFDSRNQQSDYQRREDSFGRQYTDNPYNRSVNEDGSYRYSYVNRNEPDSGGYHYIHTTEPSKPSKGSSTGKKIVAAVIAIIVVAASVGIGSVIGRKTAGKDDSTSEMEISTTADSAQLNTETSTSEVSTTGAVSPGIAVAEKARDSVVGVIVYDANGALYGEGSGVVMGTGSSGNLTYIITCAHVISESKIKSCGILLEDGTVYDAKIVGFDERTDIGVLSIEKTGLPTATFGDSTALKVGEDVYAIGNPGGSEYYGSMSDGIISSVDRSISSTYTMEVIQHTAAISPGNSGGALVNSQGQVIAINSSKISSTDYEGMGFAVPIATAKPVVESLISYGYVPNRPKLGISYASVTDYQLYSMVVQIKGLPKGSVIIAKIASDSAFAGTKVEVGDMITAVNGKKLNKSDVLLDVIDNSNVGDTLTLSICRINSRTYELTTFDVKVKLVEDKGSSAQPDKEEETTNYFDYYFNNGGSNGGYGDFEDFFRQFFGQ